MKWYKMMTAAALAAAVGLTGPWPAWAASPEFARTGEEWAKLRDDVIEYGELADLIHEYNATVQNNQYDYQKFREDYGDTNSEVADAYYDLAQDYYNDMSGEDDASSRMSDLNLQILGDNMMEQADESLEDSKIYLLTYEQAEKDLVVTAQSKMISYYEQLLKQQQKEASLEEAKQDYSLAQVKYAAGTITQVEVLSAQEAVQSAEDELKQLGSEIRNTKETLLVLLGWNYNDSPVIGELPELDMSRIDSMDPEKELNQALENNYTLKINRRKLENAKSQTTSDSLKTAIANNEKQIGASLSSAYKSVLSARITYQQALTQAQLEETNTQIAAGKLQAGMMTRLEYEKQVHARDNSQITSKTAALSLMTAMENYQWAVNGLAAAE